MASGGGKSQLSWKVLPSGKQTMFVGWPVLRAAQTGLGKLPEIRGLEAERDWGTGYGVRTEKGDEWIWSKYIVYMYETFENNNIILKILSFGQVCW